MSAIPPTTQLDEKGENKIILAKNVMDIETKKIIATLLYSLSFIIEVMHVFSLANNAVSVSENFKYVPLYFLMLSFFYFEFIFAKDKKRLEYQPWHKSYWWMFIFFSLLQLIIYLISLILLGKIVYFDL